MSEEQVAQQKAEARAMAKLEHHIKKLDGIDRQRDALRFLIDVELKALAKARGMTFIRLEAVRQEIENG